MKSRLLLVFVAVMLVASFTVVCAEPAAVEHTFTHTWKGKGMLGIPFPFHAF